MHWARVIQENDNPEWTAVMHRDGTVSEVKVTVENDEVKISVATASGKHALVQSSDGDSYPIGVTSTLRRRIGAEAPY
jgi:hypothetical protein